MSKRFSSSFIKRLRSRLSKSTPQPTTNTADAVTLQKEKLLWITPFQHYKLSPNIHHPIDAELCELTKNEYTKFINTNNFQDTDDPSVINNAFFKHQGAYLKQKTHVLDDDKFLLAGGWHELEQSESFKILKQHVYECLLSYFKSCIRSEDELELLCSKHLNGYGFMGVHLNDSHHPSHTHADAMVSSVYYVRVPADHSHQIAFQDPKGTDLYNPEATFDLRPPPFDNEFVFTPSEGDLIFFPSWLPHRVLPSVKPRAPKNTANNNIDHGNLSRLSLAFNIIGSWKHNASKHI
eukprot:48995_1